MLSKTLDFSAGIIYNERTTRGGFTMADNTSNGIYETIRRSSNTNSDKKCPSLKITNIKLDSLVPFADHPFKLYEGQQLADLVCSIRDNGVEQPIIVRSIGDEKYEILAGHNRVHAAREAGLDTVPAIIRDDLSDEDAKILVVESNFNQRSVKEMKPSELANSLHMLNEAMKKKPGYRSDLQEPEDGCQSDNRLRTMHVIGKKHDLSQATIARYIRIAQLSEGLLECLDSKMIGLGVAEQLSYLRPDEQAIVQSLVEGDTKVDLQQARELKKQSSDHELSEDEINEIIGFKATAPKRRAVKLREELFTRYFTEGETPEEIEDTIARALELLRSQSPS